MKADGLSKLANTTPGGGAEKIILITHKKAIESMVREIQEAGDWRTEILEALAKETLGSKRDQ